MAGFSAHKADGASPRAGQWFARVHQESDSDLDVPAADVELPGGVQAACETIHQFLSGDYATRRRAKLQAELDRLGTA